MPTTLGRREWEVGCYGEVRGIVVAETQEEALRLAGYGMQVRPAQTDEELWRRRALALQAACETFREAVLNDRHQLAELTDQDPDVTNAVLGLFDDTIGAAIAAAEGR